MLVGDINKKTIHILFETLIFKLRKRKLLHQCIQCVIM